jgi:hypothetical protein
MKRPETHKAGDLAENMVEQAFLRNNWIVNRQNSDYGFDFFVQYLDLVGGAISALIQVKALLSAIKWKHGRFVYRLERRYVQYWNQAPEPVYLCIVDIEASKIFVQNALHIDVESKAQAKSISIRFDETLELTETRFSQIVTEVRRWWAPVRFLKARYLLSGKDPTKDRRLMVNPSQQASRDMQGFPADKILTSDIFSLVTTRDPRTYQYIERYIELIHASHTTDTSIEIAQIAETLRDIPPLDEFEIRYIVNAFVQKPGNERTRPPDLLRLVRALGNLGRSRSVSDDEWLAWMDVSTRCDPVL